MDLISVIVPVYNVEKYLDRCIRSIVDQTYENLEIILVDDGSPDNCGVICDAWAEKDSRIRVIHKENGGLSDARNAGMAAASGAYMGFVDSDDYISREMYQQLYDRLISDGSDISACGVEMVYEDGSHSRNLTPSGICVLDKTAAMEAVIRESWLKQPVWYKLYKTELVRDILFPVGKCHEDVFWTWQAVARAEKVSVFGDIGYYYVQRSGSIMGEGYSLRRLDAVEAKQCRLAYLAENYPVLVPTAQINFLFTCMYHGQLALRCLDGSEKKQALNWLRDAVGKCALPHTEAFTELSFAHRLWLQLAKRSFRFCCCMRNLLRIGI